MIRNGEYYESPQAALDAYARSGPRPDGDEALQIRRNGRAQPWHPCYQEKWSCPTELLGEMVVPDRSPAALGILFPDRNLILKVVKALAKMPPSAELKDGSKASSPPRSSSSPSQQRQLDNFNYSNDGGLDDRRCGLSAGPINDLNPSICASSAFKRRKRAEN